MAVKSKEKQWKDAIAVAHFKWEFVRRNDAYHREYAEFDSKFGGWIRKHGRHPWMKDKSDVAVRYYFEKVYPHEVRIRQKWSVTFPTDPERRRALCEIQRSNAAQVSMPIPPSFANQTIWVWRNPSPIEASSRLDLYICLAGPKSEIMQQVEEAIDTELVQRKNVLRRPKEKRRRMDQYETYLKVWDSYQIKKDPRLVAESLYPDELQRWDTDATRNRRNPSNPVIQRVRDQYAEACRLIGGGYKDLK
jgi:hypothetical protein